MVTVRMARFGAKKRPFYHIVVTDKASRRDGRFLEQIGTYDSSKPPADARVDRERLDYWLGVGATVSESLAKVLRDHKKALDARASS